MRFVTSANPDLSAIPPLVSSPESCRCGHLETYYDYHYTPRVKPGVTKGYTIPSINRAIAASRALRPPASCVVSVISTRL